MYLSSSVRSDCEVNDVVEMAKDDRLTDKLYTETLRALKLDALKIWAGVTGAVKCLGQEVGVGASRTLTRSHRFSLFGPNDLFN